jgi:hypothetical protein
LVTVSRLQPVNPLDMDSADLGMKEPTKLKAPLTFCEGLPVPVQKKLVTFFFRNICGSEIFVLFRDAVLS